MTAPPPVTDMTDLHDRTPLGDDDPSPAGRSAEDVLAVLRTPPGGAYAARGLGPLLVAALLLAAMVLLAPSVAPERIVERPVDPTAGEGSGEPSP